MYTTTRIRMARKAGNHFVNEDFCSETVELAAPTAGDIVCKTRYISLDPYLSGLMRNWPAELAGWCEGIIVGRMVGEVTESQHPDFVIGDWVTGDSHWQGIEIANGKLFTKIKVDSTIPASAYLGVLGSSGLTAWVGINRILKLQAGETLTISSAAGTVGAIAGQLAKQIGATVIGIAGGRDKCQQVVDELGFDQCIDHHHKNLEAAIADAAPEGIHAHFENVGAKTLDPALAAMKDYGRIALCGLISHYFDEDAISLKHFRRLLTAGLTLQGFRLFDYFEFTQQAQADLITGIKSGTITVRETITTGISNAPDAYLAMLAGKGSGKHLIYCPDE